MATRTLDLLINIEDRSKTGLLRSFSSAAADSIPALTRGDGEYVSLRFVRPSSTEGDFSANGTRWEYIDPADAAGIDGVRIGIGSPDIAPTGGTFGLTYNGSSTGLTGIAYTVSAATLQTTLNAV